MGDVKAILLAPTPHILQGIYPYPYWRRDRDWSGSFHTEILTTQQRRKDRERLDAQLDEE